MGGRRAWRVRAWSHVARKRPRGGPWVACNRAGARLRSAGHRLCCSCAARPSSSAGMHSSAFSGKAWNRPGTTCDRQLKASAFGRANLAPVKLVRVRVPLVRPSKATPTFHPGVIWPNAESSQRGQRRCTGRDAGRTGRARARLLHGCTALQRDGLLAIHPHGGCGGDTLWPGARALQTLSWSSGTTRWSWWDLSIPSCSAQQLESSQPNGALQLQG